MTDTYDASFMEKSTKPIKLPENKVYKTKGSFEFNGQTLDINQYLKDTRTEGLLIILRDTIVFEQYWEDLEQDESHISWSMSKSLMSILIGVYYEKGLFELTDPVTKYLPQFKGTGYDGVTIKNLLQMSSGVAFNEDYGDFNSDINKFGRAFAIGSSLEEFAKSLKNEKPQGTYNHYVSIDTQVLGILLRKVTGRSITDLCQEHVWEVIGMEHDASWIVDNTGMEMVLGGLNATLRDFAKIGLLFKHKGALNGKRVVSEQWVHNSITPDAPHLMPGDNPASTRKNGYGYQWWIPNVNHDAFAMGGIYNQYVYVDPVRDIIIAKLSANHKFKTEGIVTKDMHFVMFESMIKDVLKDLPAVESEESLAEVISEN